MLTTGNKSEMSVGYATLYGDMAGGLAVIKDVPKQLVYELVEHRNERAGRELVPAARCSSARRRRSCAPTSSTRTRCRPTSSSTGCSRATSSATSRADDWPPRGCPPSVVDEVIQLVDRAEYKRRQAPPGSGSPARPSAATGGCRSPTASAARAGSLNPRTSVGTPRRAHSAGPSRELRAARGATVWGVRHALGLLKSTSGAPRCAVNSSSAPRSSSGALRRDEVAGRDRHPSTRSARRRQTSSCPASSEKPSSSAPQRTSSGCSIRRPAARSAASSGRSKLAPVVGAGRGDPGQWSGAAAI